MWDLFLTIYCSGSRNFSSCSAEDFEKLTLNKGGSCLLNIPKPDEAYSAPSCGNKLVDPGEECDCGTAKVSPVFQRRLWAFVVSEAGSCVGRVFLGLVSSWELNSWCRDFMQALWFLLFKFYLSISIFIVAIRLFVILLGSFMCLPFWPCY